MKRVAILTALALTAPLSGCAVIGGAAAVAGAATSVAGTAVSAASGTASAVGKAMGSSEREKAVRRAVSAYKKAARRVSHGQSKGGVLKRLTPSQRGLPPDELRAPDYHNRNGRTMEVHYLRSAMGRGRPPGDSAFTPYLFAGGVLVAVGWAEVREILEG